MCMYVPQDKNNGTLKFNSADLPYHSYLLQNNIYSVISHENNNSKIKPSS